MTINNVLTKIKVNNKNLQILNMENWKKISAIIKNFYKISYKVIRGWLQRKFSLSQASKFIECKTILVIFLCYERGNLVHLLLMSEKFSLSFLFGNNEINYYNFLMINVFYVGGFRKN